MLRVNLVNPPYQNEPMALGPQGDDCIRLREEVLFSFLGNSLLEDLINPILGANVHAVMTSMWLAQESSDAVGNPGSHRQTGVRRDRRAHSCVRMHPDYMAMT